MTGHKIEQIAHSVIGASSCERWWNCPGSVKLNEKVPAFAGSKYTAEGTVAHHIADIQLKGYITVDASGNDGALVAEFPVLEDEIGRSYVEDGFEIEVTDNMTEAIQVYVDTVQWYLREYGLSWAYDLRTEIKFDLTHIDPEAFGTCDALIVAPMNRLIVIDYKHGQGNAVEVEDNHQLLYYGLGAYYSLPKHIREEMAYVETVIVQPRAYHKDGPVRKHLYTVKELLDHEVELKDAIGRVRQGDETLNAGSWCKWCNAKPVCPAQREAIQKSAQLDFTAFELEPVKLPTPETLTPEQLSILMDNAALLREWVSSVVAYATAVADRGIDIPGYKLTTKYGRRRWTDEKTVEDLFSEFGDARYNKKMKSPAQMEKVLKAARKAELEPYIEKPETGKVLVSASDEREALETGAAADFCVYED